jgi:hypothetical protein
MHDEDENGGGNTSSSQPDNIGVANEDDGNDVDVVKQWGIRHGEAEQVPTGPHLHTMTDLNSAMERNGFRTLDAGELAYILCMRSLQGNTSSSQPDNIGVPNEDNDNDVDVVKQWGIRHREAEPVPTGPKVDVPRTPPDDVKTWLRQNASGMPPEMMPKDYTTAANQYQAQFVAEQLEQMEAQPTGLQPSMWAVDVKKAGTVVHSATGATKKAAKHAASVYMWTVYGREIIQRQVQQVLQKADKPENQKSRQEAQATGRQLFQLPLVIAIMHNMVVRIADPTILDESYPLFFDTEGEYGNLLWLFAGIVFSVSATYEHSAAEQTTVVKKLTAADAAGRLWGYSLDSSQDVLTLQKWGMLGQLNVRELQINKEGLAKAVQRDCLHKVWAEYQFKGMFYASYTAVRNSQMLQNLLQQSQHHITYIMAEGAAYLLLYLSRQYQEEIVVAWLVFGANDERIGCAVWSQAHAAYVCHFDDKGTHRSLDYNWKFDDTSSLLETLAGLARDCSSQVQGSPWILPRKVFQKGLEQVEGEFPAVSYESHVCGPCQYLNKLCEFLELTEAPHDGSDNLDFLLRALSAMFTDPEDRLRQVCAYIARERSDLSV